MAASVLALSASQAAPPGQAVQFEQLSSPDQVPDGLSKSDWQSIRAAYEAGRHEFKPVAGKDGQWQARNPGQQWLTTVDQQGFTARPQDAAWAWGLQLQSYGFGEAQTVISGTPVAQAAGQRLTCQWDATMQEWLVNDQRGLEHGFTLAQRPAAGAAGASALSLTLSTRGDLTPVVGAQGVTFQDASGAALVSYTGLKVWDADHTVLASHFEPAGERSFRLVVEERAARYPITIDPIAQQAYLKASNTGGGVGFNPGDNFGYSVAISGDTVVVGAFREDSSATGVDGDQNNEGATDSGAAYVFTRSGSTWSQQAYLKASNTEAQDRFGYSVAISGDTVVVGAIGEDSSATGIDSTPNESASSAGAAYVFTRSGSTWSQQAYLKASNTGAQDRFGLSVAVSGDTVVIGAYQEDSSTTGVGGNQNDETAFNAGAAYVFTRSGSTWSQQAYLKASNTGGQDQFGYSVAISGDTVVVGAIGEDSSATGVGGDQNNEGAFDSGAAYVFTRSGSTWSQQAYLKASNTGGGNQFSSTPGDNFGWSVAISGDTVVVGAYGESSSATGVDGDQNNEGATDSGAAYVFTRSGSTWSQQAYLKASNTGSPDNFGISVAISGDTVVVGAYLEDSSAPGIDSTPNESATDAGAAYVFTRSGSTWSQQAYLKASNTGAYDYFGTSVAISGDTVVVGAPDEDSSATGVDGDQSLNNASASGAAYLFTLPTAATAPLVTAPTSASITATTATLGGNVTGDGGATITERGIVYALTGTNADPSIGGTGVTQVTTTGTTGIFTLPVTGLSPASGYSYKAYATNSIGTTYTSAATFTTLTMVNHAPVAQDQTLTTPVDTALAITLTATDADNDTLTYALATPPPSIEGTVTGTGANVTFTPAAGFAGLAAFSFTANDGTDQSNEATIFVNVVAAPGSLDVLNTGTDAVPGAPVGSQYFNIRPTAKLNESGHVAFRAWLHVGSGGVTSANDTGIWYQDASGTLQLAGLEGSSAPGTASDVFATFSENPAWTDDGSIAFPAGLLVNHSGIWKDGTLIAQGNAPLPGGSGEVFGNLAFPVLMNNAGQMAFKAQLKAGVGGATTATDELILTRNTSGVINIAAREGSVAPGTTGGLFLKLTSMPDWISQDESGRTVFAGQVATRTTAPVINTVNNRGLWISDGTTTSLAVRGGDPAAGLTATELYYQPSYPVISAGQIAFYSLLRGPTVTAGINDAAIFAGTPGVDLTIIARLGVGSGAGAPAGASTTEFAKLGYPRLGAGAAPTLAFRGELKVGVAAVTLEDNEGIWKKTNGGSPELVVRESDAAPGLPGVQFGTLGQPFVGENGLVLFTSLLKGTGVSGVNDASLWVQLADGTLKQLLRQGQTLSMGLTGETVSDLHATLSGFTGLYSEAPRVMNENDQVVVTVPFTDGTWGVVVLDL